MSSKNPMPISEERKAEITAKARPILMRCHAELLQELDAVLVQNLSKEEQDKAIFLIIDGYQTAYVSMATHINTLRTKRGATTEMSINMPYIPGMTDIKSENMS